MWDVLWDRSLQAIYETYRALGHSLESAAAEGRAQHNLPAGLWPALAAAGFFEKALEEPAGLAYAAAAMEGLTYGIRDPGTTISVIAHVGLCLPIVSKFSGGEDQEESRPGWLRGLCNGVGVGSFALTEAHGGSEPFNVHTTLRSMDAENPAADYVLCGEKWH